MNPNFALYSSINGDVIAKLAGKEAQHISDTTIDLWCAGRSLPRSRKERGGRDAVSDARRR